jgi:hypothetical protein
MSIETSLLRSLPMTRRDQARKLVHSKSFEDLREALALTLISRRAFAAVRSFRSAHDAPGNEGALPEAFAQDAERLARF